MKIFKDKNITVGEATLHIYKTIESLGHEFNSEELNELKEFVLNYMEQNGGSDVVKNIFTFVFDNYNDLKSLID